MTINPIDDNDLLDPECEDTSQDENPELNEAFAYLMRDVDAMASWLNDFNARIDAEIAERKANKSLAKNDLFKDLVSVTLDAVTSYANEELRDGITNIRLEVQESDFPFPLKVFAITEAGETQLEYELQDEDTPIIAELDALSADFNSQYARDKKSINRLMAKIENSLRDSMITDK